MYKIRLYRVMDWDGGMQKVEITDLRLACMGHVGTPAFLSINVNQT